MIPFSSIALQLDEKSIINEKANWENYVCRKTMAPGNCSHNISLNKCGKFNEWEKVDRRLEFCILILTIYQTDLENFFFLNQQFF